MPIYFVHGNILLQHNYKAVDKLQKRCISLPIATGVGTGACNILLCIKELTVIKD